MTSWALVFLAAALAGLALRLWLVARQRAHVRAHADRVPAAFSGRIALADHRRAAAYTADRLAIEQWDLVLGFALLMAWTFGGGLDLLDRVLGGVPLGQLWHGTALVLGVLLISAALELPLSAWRTFGVEARHGFNRSSVAGFVRDKLLGLVLTLVLGVPLVAVVLWLMSSAGSAWWLWAWGVWFTFTLALTALYPTLIAPLFNRFEQLDDAALRQRLERLLERCGFHSRGMFVMDGSRRSAHGNAYFTGFGANKRIVFYDTLLDGLDADEIEAVLAHELGHYKRRHVAQRLALSALAALLGLALLGLLEQQAWFFTGLGVEQRSPAMALVLFLLVAPVFTVFLTPLASWWSRRHEFEADDFAAAQTDPRFLISGLVKMYRDNASTLTPDPVYSAFHHSHPPAPVRIAHLSTKL